MSDVSTRYVVIDTECCYSVTESQINNLHSGKLILPKMSYVVDVQEHTISYDENDLKRESLEPFVGFISI